MKKIGKEVCFLGTGEKNPRNGEGSFIRLKDSRIMYAYTKYYGNDWNDHATARIEAICSSDEGESWSEPFALINKDADALNIMSVSLIRLENGDLGVLYLRKSRSGGNLICMPYFARSSDEGRSFETPICCIENEGYFVVNNDRIIKLRSGRIIFPAAYHGESGERAIPGSLLTVYSDDDGRTFRTSENRVFSPYRDTTELQEPGLFELADGRVWMYTRTAYGHQYQCFSSDGGESFGAVTPAFRFTSTDSPMLVRSAHGYTAAIFNPIGYNCLREDREVWNSPKRTPLVIAFDKEGGASFTKEGITFRNGGFLPFADSCRLLEDDPSNSYCYPALIETADGFLVAYYHSADTSVCLNAARITKVYKNEIDI